MSHMRGTHTHCEGHTGREGRGKALGDPGGDTVLVWGNRGAFSQEVAGGWFEEQSPILCSEFQPQTRQGDYELATRLPRP